jgi:hypothetical protein
MPREPGLLHGGEDEATRLITALRGIILGLFLALVNQPSCRDERFIV